VLEVRRVVPNDELPIAALRRLYEAFARGRLHAGSIRSEFTITVGEDVRSHGRAAEFFAELAAAPREARLREDQDDAYLEVHRTSSETTIELASPSADDADRLISVVSLTRRDAAEHAPRRLQVFLGHGRDHQWRALRDHLRDHPGIEVLTYEDETVAGDAARSVLESLADRAELAIVLHTAEVRVQSGWSYAVPNVIHETGFFQGLLGWNRTLIVREDTCRPATNVSGLTEVRFSDGNVREAFGDVVAFLRRKAT